MLASAGAPILEIGWPEPAAIGAEFARWEIATAVAGGLLKINPFDEPNVQQAKDATKKLLLQYQSDHRFPAAPPDATAAGGATLTLTASAKKGLSGKEPDALLTLVRPGDYVALLAYLGPDPADAAAGRAGSRPAVFVRNAGARAGARRLSVARRDGPPRAARPSSVAGCEDDHDAWEVADGRVALTGRARSAPTHGGE